jgi:SAM-dependent methyltransferase
MATLAALLGGAAADVAHCRMLEIGCASGGNLMPIAYALPQAEFVGLDYSQRQIDMGEARRSALGLRNVRLLCRDLAEAGDDLGTFDYIVAHGVYSWVPPEARDHLLRLCKRLLRPHGIAYVSYNTYPGWHLTGVVRDAMLYHARGVEEPAVRADRAREVVRFLAESVSENTGAYAGLFQNYLRIINEGLKGSDDAFLLHDELEETNDPVYFYQFVEHAERHGLTYFVEAELRDVLPAVFKPEVQARLQTLAQDAVQLEQYMDFLRNRMFRQTLLCHADAPVQRLLRPEPVYGCLARSRAQEVSGGEEAARPGFIQFRGPDGATLTTDHPVSAAAMKLLGAAWPRAVPFAMLIDQARDRVPAIASTGADEARGETPPDERMLAGNLLRAYGYSTQLVDLHTHQPELVAHVAERPVASPVARLEALHRSVVTNLWHERVTLQTLQCHLLARLDGTRTHAQLLAELAPIAATLGRQGAAAAQECTVESVAGDLERFARSALLVA